MEETRKKQLANWLCSQFSCPENINLISLTGDAGFRRYFRFDVGGKTYLGVDAPNEMCNNLSFINMQRLLVKAGVKVPEVIFFDLEQGYFCLEDLGNLLLAETLSASTMEKQYQQAIDIIPDIAKVSAEDLPIYDRDFVQLELDIFTEWLVKKHLSLTLSSQEEKSLQVCFELLKDNIEQQPKVTMHRDFHSRNLMWHNNALTVIDFQDAVFGPITYDLVSLLRDCYVKWPKTQVNALIDYYLTHYAKEYGTDTISHQRWHRWIDLTGLQRHLKAAGIFCRLNYRDGKAGYMKDIPLTLSYIVQVSQAYPELHFLHKFVDEKVAPHFRAE